MLSDNSRLRTGTAGDTPACDTGWMSHPALPHPRLPSHGLYAITPDWSEDDRLIDAVEAVLTAGVGVLQYRNTLATPEQRYTQARRLADRCRHYRTPLIINNDPELAARVGAAGVHLGADDPDPASARARLGPEAIIGVSCYDRLERAAQAAAAGADYLAFGTCYPSTRKPGRPIVAPGVLTEAACFGLPRVAIGGLRPDNAGVFVAAGAEFLAVIGGVFDSPDPAADVRRFLALFDDHQP